VSAVEQAEGINRPLITFFLAMTSLLVTMDSTIANVALPHVMGSISAAPNQITWVLTSYIVASAMTMPLTGWLENRFGRKQVLLFAIGGFTLASMLCGISNSIPEIVVYRLLQGMFGAPLMPLAQAQLFDMNPPEKHGQAMAIFGLGTLIGPILGPTVGGYLTDNFSWRWIFYVNVPLGGLSLVGMWAALPHRDLQNRTRGFDFLGYGMLVLFVAAFQLVLDRGADQDWFSSVEIWTEAVVAAMALWVFVFHTASAKHSFVDPRLLRDPNFVSMSIFGFFGFMMLMSSSALQPLMLQSVLDYPAMQSGLLMMPRGFGATLGTLIAGRLMGRVDVRLIILVGLSACAFSLWRMTSFDLTMGRRPIMVAGFIQGFAFGHVMVPATSYAFVTLPAALRAEAAGLSAVLRNMGGSAGIAVMQALLTRQTQTVHASLAAHVIPSDPVFSLGLPAAMNPATTDGALALDAEIHRQAAMIAYLDDFKALALVAVFCIPLLLIIRRPAKSVGDPVHAVLD
jgi:DHA2 family multidrug resistance protein